MEFTEVNNPGAELIDHVGDAGLFMFKERHALALRLTGGSIRFVCSDTDHDRTHHTDLLAPVKAKENLLLSGLGVGSMIHALASLGWAGRMTIIEKSTDVITLYERHGAHKGQLEIIQADINDYDVLPEFFDFAYYDHYVDSGPEEHDFTTKLIERNKWRIPQQVSSLGA